MGTEPHGHWSPDPAVFDRHLLPRGEGKRLRLPLGIGVLGRRLEDREELRFMGRAAALAVALCLPAVAEAAPRWTFCVAAANGGAEVFISDVFAAEASRERIESAFKAAIERMGAARADAQCPQPREDRTEAVNAQFAAEAFNRKMGATLRAVPAGDFPAERREASHEFPSHAKRAGARPHDDQPIGSSGKPRRAEQ